MESCTSSISPNRLSESSEELIEEGTVAVEDESVDEDTQVYKDYQGPHPKSKKLTVISPHDSFIFNREKSQKRSTRYKAKLYKMEESDSMSAMSLFDGETLGMNIFEIQPKSCRQLRPRNAY